MTLAGGPIGPSKKARINATADRALAEIQLSKPSEAEFRDVLAVYKKLCRWTRYVTQFGPEPGKQGCIVPDHLLAEYGITKEAAA
ncbi:MULTISPECIES: hypothetical protein [unclassified Bradyrhizobium]|uniref:hypothetical protein n=1 Tax=unclassified Bradyrhizobium TaxID=2631580 RepID=UPI00247AE311|nr:MULTISPECIES: hypothetical protein [unclassified Bradyrhizobium]WGR70488.1 hypothetical protein MTX24_34895 [Bradyrhizobium sp. ISRA426]WGR82544.1 hypothetical protein MTX21_19995 [Bradyrhizobium sp. ISRA430]WGR85731.1 hypothetical protein MTX25_34580 [Bradyrhizobium sp. ISRA432]